MAVSGPVDYITDGKTTLMVSNGDPLLQTVTATGCSVTALIAAFVAAAPGTSETALSATAHALAFFKLRRITKCALQDVPLVFQSSPSCAVLEGQQLKFDHRVCLAHNFLHIFFSAVLRLKLPTRIKGRSGLERSVSGF